MGGWRCTRWRAIEAGAGGLWLLLGCALFGLLLFKHLAYPVLWNDEAETAMYGLRVLEYGYPVVHGPRNVVYLSPLPPSLAIDEASDAYLATGWGHFYLAGIGAALARGHDDPYERTLRLRAPFALAGLSGLIVLCALAAGALAAPSARVAFAALFFWLACFDVSLLLQLREVRYPPLLLLLACIVLLGWVRGRAARASGRAGVGWTATTAIALLWVFFTFYPAYAALGAGLVVDRLARAFADRDRRVAPIARDLAPLWISLAVVAAILPFSRTLAIAAAHREVAPFGVNAYLANLARIVESLLLHEHLALLLVTRGALFALGRLDPGSRTADERRPRELAHTLLWVSATYAAVMATNPWLFGRYLVPIGAWICAVVALDTFRLVGRLRAVTGDPRLRARLVAAGAAALSLAALAWHGPDLAGRWHEIWHRYQGPMDYAVDFLRATYGETDDLVVATNYEDVVLMYYLDARVRSPLALRAEGLAADVVIPRRAHPAPALRQALRSDAYRVIDLPVLDLPFNNIPELYPWKPLADYGSPTHQFRTPRPGPAERSLRVYWRPRRDTPGAGDTHP